MTKEDDHFALMVSPDPDNTTRPIAERYTNKVSVIRRADQLKRELRGTGWREPELHEHDPKTYGRLTLVRPPGRLLLFPGGPE